MRELKRHHINEVMDMHNLTRGKMGYSFVYYADDVDKVIADSIEKNKRLANMNIIKASETIKDLYKEIRRHKYKRCLAMANYCYTNVHCIMGHRLCALADWKKEWFERWHKRWLELANKFKEGK